jgi:prepilin-type N-terminal cleavage/methylation domain-containing protein
MSFKDRAFTVVEVMIAVAILAGFSAILSQFISHQAKLKKIAEIKVGMNSLLVHAQSATKRYEFLHIEDLVFKNPVRSGLRNCFKQRGTNCESQNFGRPEFPVANVAMNEILRGSYSVDGSRCAPGNDCPIQVNSEWTFDCLGTTCSGIIFRNTVEIDSSSLGNPYLVAMLSAIPPLEAESEYSSSKSVGIVKVLSSNCASVTGVNFDTGAVECATSDGSSTNLLFDAELGSSFQNMDARLIASAGSNSSTSECPNGTVSSMENGTIACNKEPSLLCTNENWVIKGGKCCNPTIPGGGNGWGAWSACSKECDSGIRSRTCQFANNSYCDSVCSVGQTNSEACNTQECIRGQACWTDKAVINAGAVGGSNHYALYDQLRAQGAPWPAFQYGTNFPNHGDTARTLCRMNGYHWVRSQTGQPWKSPKNNSVLMWDGYSRFNLLNGKSYNNWLTSLSCQGRLHQNCVTDKTWIFRR